MKTKKIYVAPCVYGMEMFGGEAVMVSCSARAPKGYNKTTGDSDYKASRAKSYDDALSSASPVKGNFTDFDW